MCRKSASGQWQHCFHNHKHYPTIHLHATFNEQHNDYEMSLEKFELAFQIILDYWFFLVLCINLI